jgi:hypothetical protein
MITRPPLAEIRTSGTNVFDNELLNQALLPVNIPILKYRNLRLGAKLLMIKPLDITTEPIMTTTRQPNLSVNTATTGPVKTIGLNNFVITQTKQSLRHST